jgi:hypothetical protein
VSPRDVGSRARLEMRDPWSPTAKSRRPLPAHERLADPRTFTSSHRERALVHQSFDWKGRLVSDDRKRLWISRSTAALHDERQLERLLDSDRRHDLAAASPGVLTPFHPGSSDSAPSASAPSCGLALRPLVAARSGSQLSFVDAKSKLLGLRSRSLRGDAQVQNAAPPIVGFESSLALPDYVETPGLHSVDQYLIAGNSAPPLSSLPGLMSTPGSASSVAAAASGRGFSVPGPSVDDAIVSQLVEEADKAVRGSPQRLFQIASVW